MVLSNRSWCMILTMVGNFDHLHHTLRLISGVLGMKSVAYLGYLCCRDEEWFARGQYSIKSRSYGRRKCSGEREEMDSRLEHLWSFYLSSLFRLSWVEVWVLSPFSFSFFLCFFGYFFKEDDPYSMRLELLEGSIFLDRPFEMDRLIGEIFGFAVRGIVWQRWISIPGIGNWHARQALGRTCKPKGKS